MKYLIVNADDFGLNDCRDDAVIKLLKEGLITSATVLVNHGNTGKAIKFINNNKLKCCGIHLKLSSGPSTSDPEKKLSLDLSRKSNIIQAVIKYSFYKKEVKDQIKRASTLWDVSHLDGHLHIQTFPVLYSSIIKNMKQNGLNKIRNTFSMLDGYSKPKMMLKNYYRQVMKRNRIVMPDYLFDISYFMENISQIQALPENTVVEVLCHPEITVNKDFELLTSSDYKSVLSKFQKISYNELGNAA